jgi:hypothetical protein
VSGWALQEQPAPKGNPAPKGFYALGVGLGFARHRQRAALAAFQLGFYALGVGLGFARGCLWEVSLTCGFAGHRAILAATDHDGKPFLASEHGLGP